jgi:hypothetical protein
MTILQAPPPLPPEPGAALSLGGPLGGGAEVMITLVVMGAILLMVWPLIRAFARRLEGGGAAAELQGELETLRARVDQLEQGQTRVGELEERLDFAERMLAQSREPDRLQR